MEEMLTKPNAPAGSKETRFTDRRERRKQRNSLEREDSLSEPKLKLKLNSQKETNKYKDISQIRHDEDKSTIKAKVELDTSRKIVTAKNSQPND